MPDESEQSVRLFSYYDDQPTENIGSLIPRSVQRKHQARSSTYATATRAVTKTIVPVIGFAAFALVAASGYGIISSANLAAAPTVTIYDPTNSSRVAFSYGPQVALSRASFFSETRDAFIDESVSFIEVDLDASTVRYFKNGVLLLSSEILAEGQDGSWWDAPSGLYQIGTKDERQFSTYTQAYFPWSVTFEGNYVIHGWPEYPDGSKVPETFAGGGIRLSNEDAQKLFEVAEVDIPVLVHKEPVTPDSFVYEPLVPDITAQHYLVADLENGSILAASDIHDAVPIASLTKLMTAVVAAEKMSLDRRVRATSPTFVESLIPRLAERSTVSMYSLLQLLLVESSNEAAEVIAGEYGREEFITEMNTKARQIGMYETTFADPSGLNASNTSSLGDLYQLTRHIHNHRDFIFEITATGEATGVQGGGEFEGLVNFNQVKENDNFVGGKVGETNAAGQTSVSLHEVTIQGSKRTVVLILLGSEARNDDVLKLLSFVESRYSR